MRTRILLVFLSVFLFSSPCFAQKAKAVLNSEVSAQLPDQNVGAITPAILRGVLNDLIASWQQYSAVNPQAGTSYTIQLSDYGQLVTFNNSSPVAVTLPQGTGSFTTFNVYISNLGSGLVTVTPTVSTINGGATFSVTTGQSVWIISDGTNYQVFRGFGSGVVNAGTGGQLAYYPTSAASVSSNTNLNVLNGTLTVGVVGTPGALALAGLTSGNTTLQPQGNATGTLLLPSPSGTDTLVDLAGIQALVNKTYNGLTIVTTTKTLTMANSLTLAGVDNKTATFNNSLTFAGADSTTQTFPLTNANVAVLNIADQTLSGGANVTSGNLGTFSSGSHQIDCGTVPLQYFTNNGAFILSAPNNDGSCIVLDTNGASAGSITFAGFSEGSNTGDPIGVTNANKFSLQIWRVNGTAGYRIAAHQ